MIRVPGVKPARIDVPVSGIDISPTLLDLAGADTPPTFMGQSLVPFLRGERPKLDRPIAGDERTVQSLVLGRYKIIDDRRRHSIELYDLSQDPREKNNLFGGLDGEDELMLKALRHFFAVRAAPPTPERVRKGDRQARQGKRSQ
jgi:arylsulfatase A-like enzyme